MSKVPMWARIVIVIVVGSCCWVAGWNIYQNDLAASNFDAVTSDLIDLSARAQQYYRHSVEMDGGGGSFTLLNIYHIAEPTAVMEGALRNENGSYTILKGGTKNSVTIQGIGYEDSDGDGTPCTAQVQVWKDSLSVTPINR
ncbi:hypothetical protein KJ840_00695 [Patescibacteria group bacterium]|nr:hypothetical protein [Patescibacteria group bacterium]